MLDWDKSDRYSKFRVGSEDEDGHHKRSATGWPWSVYRAGLQPGVTDVVLCHGIQDFEDASRLCRMANAFQRL